MIHNCGEILQINYKQTCCLKHLIEMSEQAEIQLLTSKYGKLLLRTLYHLSQNGQLLLDGLNLEITSPFLGILSKYISHFFFLNKYSYSKILSKVANQISEATIYREHPDVIFRLCAIKNNMACVYEKEGKYQRSLTELSYCKNYLCCNKDKLIFYNNYISIQMKAGNLKEINASFTQLKKSLIEETEKIKSNKLYKDTTNDLDIKLISFIMFNLGSSLEHLQRIKEAKEIFKMGFEFTICMLGENNHYSEKYNDKIEKYSLNKVESIHIPIESEDEIIIEDLKRKKMARAKKADLNSKLEMILNQLESIGNKFDKKELTENDQQEIYNEALKIKTMINAGQSKAKENEPNKAKIKKNDSNNSKKTDSSFNIKNRDIENMLEIKQDITNNNNNKSLDNSFNENSSNNYSKINLNKQLEQINLLEVDLLSEYQTDQELNKDKKSNNFKSSYYNNSKGTDQKNKSSPPIQMPKISLDSIKTDDRYECETFYQKKNTNESISQNNNFNIKINLDEDASNVYQCVTFYMKKLASSREMLKSEDELLEDETKVSSLVVKVQSQDFDLNDYFDSLIKPKGSKIAKELKVFRFIDDSQVILSIQPQATSLDISIDSEAKHASFDYDKLKKCLSQLMLKHSLPHLGLFSEFQTIEDFTHRMLSNYISCRYQDGYKFGISKQPIGVFTKKAINFTIRFSKCTFNILVFNRKVVRLLIYSYPNEDQSIEIDSIFDEGSFNDLFKANQPILSEKTTSNQYSMKANDYAQDEVLMKLGKNIQKLVNAFCIKRNNTSFEDFSNDKNLRFKCVIKAHCDDVELTISEFTEKLFKVMQMTTKTSILSEGIIYSCDLNTIFGYETKDLFHMTNYYEKTFISQMVLSSIETNKNTSKLQLASWSIVSHFNFTLNGRVCNVSHINLGDNSALLMKMYYSITFQDHCKFLVPTSKVKAFDFFKLKSKLKKIFVCALANINKQKDNYLETFEV